jgi:hypothetical protein
MSAYLNVFAHQKGLIGLFVVRSKNEECLYDFRQYLLAESPCTGRPRLENFVRSARKRQGYDSQAHA